MNYNVGDLIKCVSTYGDLRVDYSTILTVGKVYAVQHGYVITDIGSQFHLGYKSNDHMFCLVVPSVNSVTSTQTLSNGQPQVHTSPGWPQFVLPQGVTINSPPDYKEGDEIVCTGFDPAYKYDFTVGRVYKVFKNYVHLKVKTDTNWEFILGDHDVSFAPRYSQGVLPNSTECRHDWKEYFGLNQRDYYCTKTGCKARKPYE